jgi:hypothetical protein
VRQYQHENRKQGERVESSLPGFEVAFAIAGGPGSNASHRKKGMNTITDPLSFLAGNFKELLW